jgi:hypothetical protein
MRWNRFAREPKIPSSFFASFASLAVKGFVFGIMTAKAFNRKGRKGPKDKNGEESAARNASNIASTALP